jgi:hypothetical protein
VWAYRARAADALTAVEVLKLGSRRPLRVLVRFVEERFEGRQEWVPPARLKVLWDRAEQWLAAEQAWLTVREASAEAAESTEHRAAEIVLEELLNDEIIDWRDSSHAVLTVTDPATFVDRVGFDPGQLATDPRGYVRQDGAVVAPWPALRVLAQRIAADCADTLLERVDRQEQQARRDATRGRYYQVRGRGYEHISAETCAEVDADERPARQLVRQWCGRTATDRFDELAALRAEVRRLGAILEGAAATLRQSGLRHHAEQLEAELGIPIEVLRQRTRHRNPTRGGSQG